MWTNPPLVVFHGTDLQSANAICSGSAGREHAIDLAACRSETDFSQGFYLTTVERQAKDWADIRVERKLRRGTAALIRFEIDRDDLATCADLVFSNPSGDDDYWSLVHHCRSLTPPIHGRMAPYDIVVGPVSLWPQRQLMRDCDQFGFHTERSLALLRRPSIIMPKRSTLFRDAPP